MGQEGHEDDCSGCVVLGVDLLPDFGYDLAILLEFSELTLFIFGIVVAALGAGCGEVAVLPVLDDVGGNFVPNLVEFVVDLHQF